jgi:hypothetical protein
MKIAIPKFKSQGKKASVKSVIVGILLLTLVVVGSNILSSRKLNDFVEVVKIKTSIPQEGIILADNIYKDQMYMNEFEKQGIITLADGSKKRSIILWEDRGQILGSYASYFIRENSPIHWDAISKEIPKKFSYLYRMEGELLRLDISGDQFGELLVPGDKINVRASYSEKNYTLPTEASFMAQTQMGQQTQSSVLKQIKLFNNAPIIDILNGKGESIFNLYYKIMSLPRQEQYNIINSKDFSESVKPVQILLSLTPEEVDAYMAIQDKSPSLLLTLLPRTGSSIVDVVNELKEVTLN